MSAAGPVTRARRAALRYDAARDELEASIREGRSAGLSLRELAAATGLSVEWVRRIAAGTAGR